MKRFFNFLILALTCFSVCYASSGKCGNNITWNLDRNGNLALIGSGDMPAFRETPWHPNLVRTVVIGEGITSVGKNAFRKCKNLTSVNLPNSVKLISDNAFKGCISLFNISIPRGVQNISRMAFAECEQLLSIEIPDGVMTIENQAFENCKGLCSVYIASSVQRIGADAFKGCINLVDIKNLPDCVTKNNFLLLGLTSDAVSKYWKNPSVYSNSDLDSRRQANTSTSQPDKHSSNSESIVNTVSDVDIYIPQNPTNNENTFVVIIANENYSKLADVNSALNDGRVFGEYCHKTLGIPAINIRQYENASLGEMHGAIDDIKNIASAYSGELKVILYYCGHGAPEEGTNEAYLLPVDAYTVSSKTCFAISSLYKELGAMKTISTTVFLDACFSGATRSGEMLAEARSIPIIPRTDVPTGNVVVFSASSADETAMQYSEQKHGLFTYFLLKKLQETNGNVSLGELSDYLALKVKRTSAVMNRKSQTPTTLPSHSIRNNWQDWRLNY